LSRHPTLLSPVLSLRLITGPLLIALLLGLIWADEAIAHLSLPGPLDQWMHRGTWPPGSLLFAFVAVIVIPIASLEFTRLARGQGIAGSVWLNGIAAITAAGTIWTAGLLPLDLARGAMGFFGTLLIAVLIVSLILFSRGQQVAGVLAAAGAALFATIYLGVLPGFLLAIRHDHSAWVVLGILLATKASDIGAYFTGRTLGRHKLIPWLSPGKTWEGLIGGVVAGALVGAALAAFSRSLGLGEDFSALWGAVCGMTFALVGQFGDLSESLLKRSAGAKDSGRLLPGMGGMLDVLDSPLFVAPVAYWMVG